MEKNNLISVAVIASCAGLLTITIGLVASSETAAHASDAAIAANETKAESNEVFTYEPLDPEGELVEPIPTDIAEFFEDYLEMDYNSAKVALGNKLFHDTRLSHDNTLSCASCHDLRYAGIDRAVTATGVRGQVGPINTPSVYNAAFNVRQFWDGRAADLEAQADGPPNAAGEMASNWEEISGKLAQDQAVVALLEQAYPEADFSNGVDSKYWLSAIADFERTLITPNSPFDKYLRGDSSAVSEEAKQGYQVFKDIGCIECHNGIAIGGKSFQRMGRKKPFYSGHTAGVNLGRYNVTGADEDLNVFKVGNLRNVALTAPYLHDGSQETLAQVVRTMAEFQLDIELSEGQTERLVAFLETLTGEYNGMSLDEMQNTVESRNESGH